MIAYLPKLKSGTEQTLQLPSKPGLWEERDADKSLPQLAHSLEVPLSDEPIHSVPDIWARAILFSNALFNKEHTLHETYLGEWRGMLAILALRQIEHFEWLKVLKLDLPVPVIEKARTKPLDFLEVAGRLKPAGQTFAPSANWDSVFLFYRQSAGEGVQFPLAFASAMTLVCTGANSRQALEGMAIPWFNGKTLEDPVRKLTDARREQMAEWIMAVRQIIGDQATTGTKLTGPLMALLKEFAEDLHAATANRERLEPTEIAGILSELPEDIPLTGKIWMILGQAHIGEGGGRSDLELDISSGRNDRYIVIDEDFAKQLGRNPSEIRVFNDINLSNARTQVTGYGSYPTGQFTEGTEGVKWVAKGFFFNDAIIVARGTTAFPGAAVIKTEGTAVNLQAIAPIADSARKLLGLNKLIENLSIRWDSRERVIVTLKLQLKDKREVEIKKSYDGNQLVIVDLNENLMGIWPNFVRLRRGRDAAQTPTNTWNAYYLYHSWPIGSRSVQFEMRAIDMPSARDRNHTEQREQAQSHFKVVRMPSFPSAIELKVTSNTETHHTGLAAGILPLKTPAAKGGGPPIELVVGVDFGSTGTNVFYRVPGGDPEKLTFANRIYPLNNNDATAAVRFMSEFIRDEEREAFNLLSLFQDFLADRSHEREVLLDGHILDLRDPQALSGDIYGKVHTNLKWKGISEKYISQDFLYQLMLQTAAEAVERNASKVEVRFSYPTAYSDGDLQYFRNSWSRIVERVKSGTGVEMVLMDGKVDCRESIAAARFFAHTKTPRKIDLAQGGLTIDIGGGTSDYAFYHKRALKGHTSILFAGRDIFLTPLRRHHQVLHTIADLRPSGYIQTLDGLRNTDVEKFNAVLDAVISIYGQKYTRELNMVGELPEVSEFLNIISVGLCGVLFYGGMVVRLLKGKDVGMPAQFRIHIGGNGCRIFDWLFQGSETFVEQDQHYLNAVNAFRAGAGASADQDVQLIKSSQPKAEVAFGLLDDSQTLGVQADRAVEFAGEIHSVDSQIIGWDKPIESKAVLDRTLYIDRRLLIFTQFLRSIGISLGKRELDDLAVSVDSKINQMKVDEADIQEIAQAAAQDTGIGNVWDEPSTWESAAPESAGTTSAGAPKTSKLLRSEPLFILTLKQYLEDRVRDWVGKYGK